MAGVVGCMGDVAAGAAADGAAVMAVEAAAVALLVVATCPGVAPLRAPSADRALSAARADSAARALSAARADSAARFASASRMARWAASRWDSMRAASAARAAPWASCSTLADDRSALADDCVASSREGLAFPALLAFAGALGLLAVPSRLAGTETLTVTMGSLALRAERADSDCALSGSVFFFSKSVIQCQDRFCSPACTRIIISGNLPRKDNSA